MDATTAITPRRFEIERTLGRGGFGEVYAATMTSVGGIRTRVAVKLLRAELDLDDDAVERLREEGRLLGILDHPSILKVIDLCQLDGRIALVTEYIDGADLKQCIQGADAMPLRPALEVTARVAEALDAAWSTVGPDGRPLNIVHRDVKPANIRVGRRGQVKLLDFGIARASLRPSRTQTNVVLGSFGYLAPERLRPGQPVTAPSDIFSLGCVLFEAIVNRPLLVDLEPHQHIAIAMSRAEFDRWVGPRLEPLAIAPPGVVALVREMLAFDPDARPAAAEVARRCEELAEQAGGAPLRRWCRDWSWPEPAKEPSDRLVLVEARDEASGGATLDVAAPSGRWRLAGLIGVGMTGMGLAGAIAGAVLVGALVAGGALLMGTSEEEPDPALTPIAVAPEPEPEPEPEPAVEAPPPPPSVPAPRPAPKPAPPRVATGRVQVRGTTEVELRQGSDVRPPGEVPAGTWEVWADFGSGLQRNHPVDVPPGHVVTLQCSRVTFDCKVLP